MFFVYAKGLCSLKYPGNSRLHDIAKFFPGLSLFFCPRYCIVFFVYDQNLNEKLSRHARRFGPKRFVAVLERLMPLFWGGITSTEISRSSLFLATAAEVRSHGERCLLEGAFAPQRNVLQPALTRPAVVLQS